MFDFAVKGTVIGFNPSKDGTKHYLKIQPAGPVPTLNRNERAGLLDITVPPGAIKGLGANTLVMIRGKGTVTVHDWRNEEGTVKAIVNHRFEAETVEAVKA